jgi:hypothetical protein
MAGESENKIQVWRVSKSATAAIEIGEKTVIMAGSRANFIAASDVGIALMGESISFGTLSEKQRHAAMFVKRNDFSQMVPTTLVTPMPDNMPWPPFGLASSIMKDLPFFVAMVVATTVPLSSVT